MRGYCWCAKGATPYSTSEHYVSQRTYQRHRQDFVNAGGDSLDFPPFTYTRHSPLSLSLQPDTIASHFDDSSDKDSKDAHSPSGHTSDISMASEMADEGSDTNSVSGAVQSENSDDESENWAETESDDASESDKIVIDAGIDDIDNGASCSFDYINANLAKLGKPIHRAIDLLNIKIDTNFSEEAWEQVRSTFLGILADEGIDTGLASFDAANKQLAMFTEIYQRQIPCCIKSCICFSTTPAARQELCPHCNEPKLFASGTPQRTFDYIPLTHRLLLQFSNAALAQLIGRDSKAARTDKIHDFWDSDIFCRLSNEGLFSAPTDVALQLSTDGVSIFKIGRFSVWPLILLNLNLPLTDRYRLSNMLCLGVIPGPKGPLEIDTFLRPMMDELELLQQGVECWDAHQQSYFSLRAHLVMVTADQPAASKLMGHTGHMSYTPCRFCSIRGIYNAGAIRCPLARPRPDDDNDSTDEISGDGHYDPM